MHSHLTIKSLPPDDRPREKLLVKGRSALSNAEILGILIGSGNREKSAVQLCQEILLSVNNDLSRLARMSVHDLMKFKGIGSAKAATITAALELGRRKPESVSDPVIITSSAEIYKAAMPYFADLVHEEFRIVLLSRSHKIISIELISKGGFSGTVADGKLIFKRALEQSASSMILCHNHPSGNIKPSQEDIQLTKKLKEFGSLIDLPVLDHLILTDNGYYSLADEGNL